MRRYRLSKRKWIASPEEALNHCYFNCEKATTGMGCAFNCELRKHFKFPPHGDNFPSTPSIKIPKRTRELMVTLGKISKKPHGMTLHDTQARAEPRCENCGNYTSIEDGFLGECPKKDCKIIPNYCCSYHTSYHPRKEEK